VDDWGTGTCGTVVQAFAEAALVEILDEDGESVGIVVAPYARMRTIWSSGDRDSAVLH
jgi:hypothetical protein